MRSGNLKIILQIILAGIVIIAVLGYAYFRTQDYLNGPQISITSPINGQTVTDPLLTVSGITEHVTAIYLNDRKIFIDKDNVFQEELLLYPGYNIITIWAVDRFDKRVEKQLKIVYQKV